MTRAGVAQSPVPAPASEERGRSTAEVAGSSPAPRSARVDTISLSCGVDELCEWTIDNVPERVGRLRQRQHEHTTHPVVVPPDVPASPAWRTWRAPRPEQLELLP